MTPQSFHRFIWTLMAALALAACAQDTDAPVATDAGTISATELSERISAGDAPVILDVRSTDEFAAGHIPGAINIAHTEVAERLGELPTDKSAEIVVHCQSGRRAGMAEEVLAEAGYSGVRHLEGDWAGWTAAGMPVE